MLFVPWSVNLYFKNPLWGNYLKNLSPGRICIHDIMSMILYGMLISMLLNKHFTFFSILTQIKKMSFECYFSSLKKCSLLKIENNSSRGYFHLFQIENAPSRTRVNFRQLKLAILLCAYKIWYLKWKVRIVIKKTSIFAKWASQRMY